MVEWRRRVGMKRQTEIFLLHFERQIFLNETAAMPYKAQSDMW